MIIVDRRCERAKSEGRPMRVGMVGAGFMGAGPHQPDRQQRPGHAHGRRSTTAGPSARFEVYQYAGGSAVAASTQEAFDEAVRGGHAGGRRGSPSRSAARREIDVVVDVTGSVEFGAHVILEAFAHGKPVVLMNAEVDATIGPILQRLRRASTASILSACDGDEPGVQMNLFRWVKGLGPHPARDRQREGAAGPLPQPDHAEGLGGAVGPERGDGHLLRRRLEDQLRAGDRRERHRLQGPRSAACRAGMKYDGSIMEIHKLYDIDELRELGRNRRLHRRPAADKVFCLAEHPDPKQRHYLNLYKMGEGPLYPFWIPYHLVHFEAPNAIARVVLFGDELAPPLAGPVVEVCAVAKRDLKAGEVLDEYGMYMTYGEAVNVDEMSAERYLPEGLVEGCRLKRDVAQGRRHYLRRRRAARGPHRRPAARRAVPALPRRDLACGPDGRGRCPSRRRRPRGRLMAMDPSAGSAEAR